MSNKIMIGYELAQGYYAEIHPHPGQLPGQSRTVEWAF